MNDQLDSFETNLLTELREYVDQRAPQGRQPRRRRSAVAWGAAVAVIGVTVIPGIGPEPAYSVQQGNSGKIKVEVNRLEDAEGLVDELKKYGVDAYIYFLPPGQQCSPGWYKEVVPQRKGTLLSIGSEYFAIELDPGTIRDGETLVVSASVVTYPDLPPDKDGISVSDRSSATVDMGVTAEPIGPCNPIPWDTTWPDEP